MINTALWSAFFVIMAGLWAAGAWLFIGSTLRSRTKVLWFLVLIGVGTGIGLLLPLAGIRDRFFIVLAGLPILAFIDVRLAKSTRSFLFWFRACAFEVCTVFAVAAVTRLCVSGIVSPN